MINVTVWGENIHEKQDDLVQKIYPNGMHQCIAESLNESNAIEATTTTLDEEEHGLTEKRLNETDVLLWWGHIGHDKVQDHVVDRIQKRVLEGMGLIVLHSGHYSKIFKRMLGTSCSLGYREAGEKERVWVVQPGHPIVKGIGRYFEVPESEMYAEPFHVPEPDETIFISWFQGGEVFRSGLTYKRGNGKIFYFSPGHETHPIYKQKEIQQVLKNAVIWASPDGPAMIDNCPHLPANEAPEPL